MLDRLPESRPRRERRPLGTAASIVTHVALVALAIVGTAQVDHAALAPDERPDLIYVAPAVPVPPSTRTGGGSGTPAPAAPRTTVPSEELVSPVTVPVGLPPIDLGAQTPVSPGDFAPRPASGSGPGSGSGPDGGGPWAAFQVEKTVVALAGATPRYPEMLRAAGIGGTVLARFVVDTLGRVEPGSVRILRATHPLFAQAVEGALPSMRFLPAEAGGHRVRQLVEEPFTFSIRP